jgi:hypothetical protein
MPGSIGESVDVQWFRKHVYTNLIVSHWQLMWEVEVLSEPHLEVLAGQFFQGADGRRYWAEAREPRKKAETSKRARRFTAILDRSYLTALAGGPTPDKQPSSGPAGPADRTRRPAASSAALMAAAAIGAGVALVGRRLWSRI